MFVKNGKVSKAVSTSEQFNDCLIVFAEFIEIFFQNTGNERSEMTAQEQAVVEEYICKINSFTDSL